MLDTFEVQYLGICLNRLFDKARNVFTKVVAPKSKTDQANMKGINASDVRNLSSLIFQELNNVKVDERLFLEVGKNVGKMIQMFTNKVEEVMLTDSTSKEIDLLSVLEGNSVTNMSKTPTATQAFNANLFNSIYILLSSTIKTVKTFAQTPSFSKLENILDPALKKMDELAKQIIQPVFDSVKSQLVSVLLNMHLSEEEIKQKQQQLETSQLLEMSGEYNSNSLFVKQFFYCIRCAKKVYFSIYDNQGALNQNIFLPLIEQLYLYITVELTLKVITLSQTLPLEEREIHFLTVLNDAKQLQLMIGDFLSDDSDAQTNAHLLFKSFLKILFLNDYQVVEKHVASHNLSHFVLVMHLLFTKVESAEWVMPPHEYMDVSLREYSNWWLEMNKNNEKAVLNVISKCVDEMKKKDKDSASKVIPFIDKLLNKCIEELQSLPNEQ